MDQVLNRRGTLTYSSKAGKDVFFKVSQNMMERYKKKKKNKKYRNVKIFVSAIIELFKEYR